MPAPTFLLQRRGLMPLLLLAACAPVPPPESVSLPPSADSRGAGDPTRGAILASAQAFGDPASLQGNPAAAAEALGQLEYLTTELAFGGRWRDLDPLVSVELRQARQQARQALGFRQDATPQTAVDALYGTAAALRGPGEAAAREALAPLAQPAGTEAALARLAALPPLPLATQATARARTALARRDSQGDRRQNRIF